MLVDILMENDCVMLARVLGDTEDGAGLRVQFFVPIRKRHNGQEMFDYEDEVTEVARESVCGRYESADERAAGYVRVGPDGFIEDIDDAYDYVPDEDEEESSSDEESVYDEDEEDLM
jgi:hypothetical protein